MKDVDRMNDAIEMMKKKNICIVVFTETHFDNHDCVEFCSLACKYGYKCFYVTRLMKKGDYGSGGVTIMVDERLKCRQIRMSNLEDLIWICIEFESERLFVGGVYLVPPSSSRFHKADELVREIGADVARFCLEGQVILAGDWNCKIGQLESVAQERVFVRKSVSDVVDARGRRMIELLNLSDVVVLNGVQKTRAQYTCRAARGDGIDDYIAVSSALVERTSEMEYWNENQVESDHVAIAASS
jgi:exonuclease III